VNETDSTLHNRGSRGFLVAGLSCVDGFCPVLCLFFIMADAYLP